MKRETKARFCAALQSVEEVLVDYWKRYVDEEKFIEAGGILRDLDLIETVRAKLKCPE